MGTKLFVGNLAFATSEDVLRSLFESAGGVASCEMISDRLTGQPRGFAFVEMSSQDDADRAVRQLHDHELDGRRIVVNEARERESRGPSGGFGGAGRGGPGAKRKSGKGSRRGARAAKRENKAYR